MSLYKLEDLQKKTSDGTHLSFAVFSLDYSRPSEYFDELISEVLIKYPEGEIGLLDLWMCNGSGNRWLSVEILPLTEKTMKNVAAYHYAGGVMMLKNIHKESIGVEINEFCNSFYKASKNKALLGEGVQRNF